MKAAKIGGAEITKYITFNQMSAILEVLEAANTNVILNRHATKVTANVQCRGIA